MDGWRITVMMNVTDDSTTDVVDVADDTPHSTFDDEVFVPDGRDRGPHTRNIEIVGPKQKTRDAKGPCHVRVKQDWTRIPGYQGEPRWAADIFPNETAFINRSCSELDTRNTIHRENIILSD